MNRSLRCALQTTCDALETTLHEQFEENTCGKEPNPDGHARARSVLSNSSKKRAAAKA